MKKAILIQARLSSSRFPQKMMCMMGDIPLVDFVYKRCSKSARADMLAVVTSHDKSDDQLYQHCIKNGIEVFRGSLNNVLDRYVKAAEFYQSYIICRVCGDSPFVDVQLIDEMLELIEKEALDYIAPNKNNCMAGFDSEVMTLNALRKALQNSTRDEEFEHVTLHMKNNKKDFKRKLLDADLLPDYLNNFSLTIDYHNDLILCNKILELLGDGYNFSSSEILKVLQDHKIFFESYTRLKEKEVHT